MLTRTVRRYFIASSVVFLLLVLYSVAGFWAVPHFLRSGLIDFVGTHYKRQLSLGEIRFNPYTFQLDVSDFSLPDSDGKPMLAFGRLHVDLELKSLFKLGPSFREILLERPLIRTVVRPDGTLNLADLGKGFPPPANPPPKPAEPMRLYIDRFAVAAGSGTFEDLSHARPFRADFKPIAFELRNFSTRARKGASGDNEYSLTAASLQGERLSWNGTFLLEPLSSHGMFEVADLQAGTIWSYLQQPMPLEIPSGVIAVKGEYNFDTVGDAPAIKVNVHDTTVSDLKLRPLHGTMDYVVLGKLDVQETRVDLTKRAVEVGKVSLTGGEVNAWLSHEGKLNLLELTGPAASATPPTSSAANGATAGANAGPAASAANGATAGANAGPAASATANSATAGANAGPAASATANSATAGANAGPAASATVSSATVSSATANGGPPAGANGATPAAAQPTPPTAPAWTVSVPDISVEGFKVSAEDRQVSPALTVVLSPLDIHVAGYNTSPDARLDVTAKTSINGSSTLNATAQLPANGSDITAHIDLKQFDLTVLQPFIAQRTAMTLKAGRLGTELDIKKSADGNIALKGDVGVSGLRSVDDLQQSFIKWKDLRVAGLQYNLQPASLHIDSITAREPYARVIIAPDRTVNVEEVLAGPSKGRPSLATQLGAANAKKATGITPAATKEAEAAKAAAKEAKKEAEENPGAAAEAVAPKDDSVPKPDGAKADGVKADGAKADGAKPDGAKADGAKADGAKADGAKSADSKPADDKSAGANSANAKGRHSRKSKPTGKEAAPAPATPAMPISIGTVRIIDGSANYADFWIQPNFAVGIQTLNGSIDGLSSDPKSRAKVKLEGKVDRYAPVNINGEMNLLAVSVYSDIKMSFKGLELTTMTPYSGRFAGYKIDKGKLSVDVTYKVDQRKLTADQHFVIDQLQLGERVESPDAVHLPLKLAVALLKDRNGVIDVPLPITGSLDDPQFKIGPIIWHAIVNLFVKVATAPFAAIGHLFGGGNGEEMKYIDFAPGSAELDNASREKLGSLSKALHEKDQLQLDVPIVYSKELDTPELARRRLNQRLVARAHSGQSPKEQASGSKSRGSAKQASASASAASAKEASTSASQASTREASASASQASTKEASATASQASTKQTVAQSAAGASSGQPANADRANAEHASAAPADQTSAHSDEPPDDPALKDPLQHYRLLLAEYQASVGKEAPLPPTAQAIQDAKNKKDAPPVETAIPELEDAIIHQIEIPDLALQDLGKQRTRAIQDVLLADGGIDASRVFIINGTAKPDANGKVRLEMALK